MEANHRLQELLAEAGCGNAMFARWVNAVGRELGRQLGAGKAAGRWTYGKTTVARWLGGATPHWPTPVVIVEALSRRLGYQVTLAELGWKDRGVPVERAGDRSTLDSGGRARLEAVASLTGKDLERRTFL